MIMEVQIIFIQNNYIKYFKKKRRKENQEAQGEHLFEIIRGNQEAQRDIGSPTRIGRGIVPGHASSAVHFLVFN